MHPYINVSMYVTQVLHTLIGIDIILSTEGGMLLLLLLSVLLLLLLSLLSVLLDSYCLVTA